MLGLPWPGQSGSRRGSLVAPVLVLRLTQLPAGEDRRFSEGLTLWPCFLQHRVGRGQQEEAALGVWERSAGLVTMAAWPLVGSRLTSQSLPAHTSTVTPLGMIQFQG